MESEVKAVYPSKFIVALLLLLLSCWYEHAGGQSGPVVVEGFPILLETVKSFAPDGSPALADLDGDGNLEIVVASGRKVYVFRRDGTLLPGWPQTTKSFISFHPVVGDVDSDGILDVVVRYQGFPWQQNHLYVWRSDGTLLPGFLVRLDYGRLPLVLYDLDRNGHLEIIGVDVGKKFYVLNHDGSSRPGWPQERDLEYWTAKPAVGDIDRDGKPEIVVTASDDYPQPPRGKVYVWDAEGRMKEGWSVTVEGFMFDLSVPGGPSLADIDGDGFLEIAVGASNLRRSRSRMYLFRYDGTVMPGWPQALAVADSYSTYRAGAAIGDMNGDGKLDVVIGDLFGHLAAWNGDGTYVEGWPRDINRMDSTAYFASFYSDPALGDVDNDGFLEAFFDHNQADLVEGEWYGRIYVFNHEGSFVPWSPLRPHQFAASNTVALGDVDNDGSLEIAAYSEDVYEDEAWLTLWRIPGIPYVKERFPWPMFGHDRYHTSQYGFEPKDETVVNVSDRENASLLPKAFVLHQNYPNPFSPATSAILSPKAVTEIRYELSAPAEVRLRIFNLLGVEVRTLIATTKPVGWHNAPWDGKDEKGKALPSGVYFYRLEVEPQGKRAPQVILTRKLVLLY